jgi:parallel beta-helix repeat protein
MKKRKFDRNKVYGTISIILFIFVGVGIPLILTSGPVDYIEIESDKDFRKYDFLGDGTSQNPYIIENLTVSNALKTAIKIKNTQSHFIIRNSFFSYNPFYGIFLDSIKNGTAQIYNITSIGHSVAGVFLLNTDSVKIHNSTCIENAVGIKLENSNHNEFVNNLIFAYSPSSGPGSRPLKGVELFNSNFTEFSYCTFYNLGYAIEAEKSYNCSVNGNQIFTITHIGLYFQESANLTVINSQFENIDIFSIRLQNSNFSDISSNLMSDSRYTLYLFNSHENIIRTNNFQLNFFGPFITASSQFNIIDYNFFYNNTNEGIYLESGAFNVIHHNSFYFNNLLGTSQALDNGQNNTWYDEELSEGNFWNEHNTSTGPYPISGISNSFDPFPLNFSLLPFYKSSQFFDPFIFPTCSNMTVLLNKSLNEGLITSKRKIYLHGK